MAQFLLAGSKRLEAVLQILIEQARHGVAVVPDQLGQGVSRQNSLVRALLFHNDLQKHATRQVITTFGINYLELLALLCQFSDPG